VILYVKDKKQGSGPPGKMISTLFGAVWDVEQCGTGMNIFITVKLVAVRMRVSPPHSRVGPWRGSGFE
jgi:hypothetical protein